MLRPLGTGEILDAGIKLYTRHWRVLMTCVVGIVLPVRILNVLLVASANPDAFEVSNDRFQTSSGGLSSAAVVAEIIVIVLLLVTSLVANAACFKAVSDAWLGTQPEAGRSLRYALRRLPALLWMTILFALLMVVAFVALIIPGIWLLVAGSLAVPALLFERVGGFKAIRRSAHLVRGKWWSTFGTLLVAYLLSGILSGIVQAAVELLPSALTDSGVALAIGSVVGSTLGAMITTPYIAAVVTLLYFDRRVRKEAFDLQLLAEGLGTERDPDAPLPAPLIEPAVTPEQRAAAPYWPPPPGWTPPPEEEDDRGSSDWLPPQPRSG
jgi:hypothetical protein